MDKANILLMSSSTGIGLTYNLSMLLIELKRRGVDIKAISSTGEQEDGLFNSVKTKGIKTYQADLDNFHPLSILRSAKTTRDVLLNERINIVHVQGISQLVRACLAKSTLHKKMKVHVVYTLNSFPKRFLYPAINTSTDLVIAPSEQVEE